MIDPTDLRDVFDRAASLPPQDRAAFLAQACGDNVALRQEVERLLAADARAGSVFDSNVSGSSSGSGPGVDVKTRGQALTPGARLGPYVIVGPIGAGGMGEVYKARDTRLDRTVAIKVLPAELVGNAEARQRFEREAHAAAALAHAHICRLLDVGREGATDYLVMEYLEGETLAARLARGKVPLRQVLTFGTQIAGALGVAHRAGIVHRDLKPGNIMLTHNGAVLLDFGLARQTAPIPMDGPTATVNGPITRTGVILGTLQYMAPEQLEGREVDTRTDIFALGVVLYEMVTGRRAFEGSNHASVIGNILHADPPALTSIDAMTPLALDRVVRKCLEKDPSERWQTVNEVQARLEALQDVTRYGYGAHEPSVDEASNSRLSNESARRNADRGAGWSRRGVVYAATAAAFLAVAAAAWLIYRNASLRGPSSAEAPAQHTLARLTFGDLDGFATFSPDGRFLVFESAKLGAGHTNLWVQPTAGGNPVQITKSASHEGVPDWSPDGASIAFERSGEGLFAISPLGGQERRLASFGGLPMWSPDGTQILFVTKGFSSAIRLFLATTDQPPRQILADFLDGGDWRLPTWHPDGRITIAGRHKTEGLGIYTVSVQDPRWVKTIIPSELLAESGIYPSQVYVLSWAPTAKYLYATCTAAGGVQNVWRLRMDPGLRITAIERLTTGPGSDWWPKVSRDGKKLLFSIITGNSRLWSFPFRPPAGESVGPGQPISEEDGEVNWVTLSRDGRRLAHYYQPLNAPSRQSELRLFSLPFAGPPERIPADRYVRMASAWSHSGDRLALQAAELSSTGAVAANLLIIREQSGSERVVARCQSASQAAPCSLAPVDWTPDDSAILVTSRLGDEHRSRLSLWSVAVEAPSEAPLESLLSDAEWNISQGAYSPDGHWLAFAYGGDFSDEKGVAVVPAGGKVPRTSWRSIADGFEDLGNPRWSPDGRFLYFTSSHGSGFMNVWRVPLMRLAGAQAESPAVVTTFNSLGFFLLRRSYYPKIAVGAERLILPMNSQKMAVWMLDNVDR